MSESLVRQRCAGPLNAAERAHWERQLDIFTKAQDRMAEELDKNTDNQ